MTADITRRESGRLMVVTAVDEAPRTKRAPWNPPTRVLVFITSALAVALFLLLGGQQLAGIITAHNNFARTRVPGAGQVGLRKGLAYVWVETNPRFPAQPGTMEVHLFSEATGQEVPIRPTRYTPTWETYHRKSTLVGEVDVPAPGIYLLSGRGGGGNTAAVGRLDEGFLLGWAVLWFALAGVALVITVVSGVLVIIRRSQS